jgi:hypothetical protein
MPEPGSTEELKAAALTAECEVEASFAQLAHVVNPWRSKPKFAAIPAAPGRPEQPETFLTTDQGICTGLCATWLDLLAKGEESTFMERMSGLDASGKRDTYKVDDELLTKTAKLWKTQNDPKWVPSPEMKDVTKESDTANEVLKNNTGVFYSIRRVPNGQPDQHSRYPLHTENLGEFVEWLNATRMGKRRFFLVEPKGHTMAAAKNRKGYLRFYDPNGGIVKTWYAKRLHKFLVLYLSTQKLFDHYKVSEVQNDLMKLTIRKYRPYNW